MRRAWHKAQPDALQRLKERIEQEFPELRLSVQGDVVFLKGSFPVRYGDEILDRYEIELEIPPDLGDSVPRLRETGGRIPWELDRHIIPASGEACPVVPEEWLLRPECGSILSFLRGPVRNFFISQSLVERGDPWPFGERAHGRPGLIQYYEELFQTNDPAAIVRYLECLSRDGLKGHWECPCGSRRRLRDCHIEQLRILRRRMPRLTARRALQRLNSRVTTSNARFEGHLRRQ
jgi:hypothetical protein